MTKIVLDTNAFYDFCYVLGLRDFGIASGINQRVNYSEFKAQLESALINKSLLVPSTTLFEFVCKLRNQDVLLKKIMEFLKNLSRKYGYDLVGYNNWGILFGFDQFSEECWGRIRDDYSEVIALKEHIMLAKIGSEADLMTSFGRSIVHLFFVDCCKGRDGYEEVISMFNRFFYCNPFYDEIFRATKFSIARELHEYYKTSQEGKFKKQIFESTVRMSALFLKEFFDFMCKSGGRSLDSDLGIDFSSADSIQTRIFKWFNKEKDATRLTECVHQMRSKLKPCGFNECQFAYWECLINDLFTHGTKREKNDAEDFWNLGFVDGKRTFLLTFELELIDVLKQQNEDNYNYIRTFYNVCG